MRVITLVENTAFSPEPEAEHGLSLLIETNGRRLLFDMGQSPAFARNAQRLGIDLGAVDTAILSHGHYDHGGGLAEFLRQNAAAPVYLSSFAFEPHFNGPERNIGLCPSLRNCGRLRFVEADTDLGNGLSLSPCTGAVPVVPVDPAGLDRRMLAEALHPSYSVRLPAMSRPAVLLYKTRRMLHRLHINREVVDESALKYILSSIVIHIRKPKSIFG